MLVLVRVKATDEEFTAYQDDDGLWINDPAGPGYAHRESDYEVIG